MDEKALEQLSNPDAGDEMAFVLRGKDPNPETSYSKEGVEAITDNIQQFILARTLAHHARTGQMPKNVRATVKLDWVGPEDEWLEAGPRPWYSIDDVSPDPLMLDGSHRFDGGKS